MLEKKFEQILPADWVEDDVCGKRMNGKPVLPQ